MPTEELDAIASRRCNKNQQRRCWTKQNTTCIINERIKKKKKTKMKIKNENDKKERQEAIDSGEEIGRGQHKCFKLDDCHKGGKETL